MEVAFGTTTNGNLCPDIFIRIVNPVSRSITKTAVLKFDRKKTEEVQHKIT